MGLSFLFAMFLTLCWYLTGFIILVLTWKFSKHKANETDVGLIGLLALFGPFVIFGILIMVFNNFMDSVSFWRKLTDFINKNKDKK